jgi:hypothetical protein
MVNFSYTSHCVDLLNFAVGKLCIGVALKGLSYEMDRKC